MKRLLPIVCVIILILGFLIEQSIGKEIIGPNISAIYRIPAISSELPALPKKHSLTVKEPFPEPVQIAFQRLYALNQNLAVEIGRLPEFQDEVEKNELLSLNRFTELIENITPEQEANLDLLLKVGLPEYRRCCTPLQAIMWLLEKKLDKQLLQYSLYELLDQSWDFSEKSRWKDYEEVTYRLNSPELVNYYERVQFVYKSKKGRKDANKGTPKKLFTNKIGNCVDHSAFDAYCLKKGGYKTSKKNVHPSSRGYHTVCVFKVNGNKYYLDNGRPDKFLRRGIVPSDEYKMYQDQVNLKTAEGKADKKIYTLQDNYGLLLVYLIQHKGFAPDIKSICADLGLSGYEKYVEKKYFKALVSQGFITNIKKTAKGFNYSLNNSLCEAFLAERYHRPKNAVARW